jgi:anti-sigma-K factor RskA
MTSTPLTPPEETDAFAAEYVLGVLDAAERARAEERIKRDSTFAASVAAWEQRLSGLNESYDEVPAPNLLPKIEARLFPVAAKPRRSWMNWLAGAVTAAAVVLAAFVILPPTTGVTFTSTLSAEGQSLVILASYSDGTIRLDRTGGTDAGAGNDYELWLIEGEKPPVSLGLIDAPQVEFAVANMPEGATLAISLEPAGGSTTGAPTGPVLVTGKVQRG